MKRIFVTFAVLFAAIWSLQASNTPAKSPVSLFQDDLSSFDREFAGLDQLEQTVQNTGKDYTQLKAENNAEINQLNYSGDISSALLGSSSDDRLAGIPGFLWGFCLGWIGILLCYLLIDDEAAKKREGKQAIVGCVVGSLIWVVLYVFLYASAYAIY